MVRCGPLPLLTLALTAACGRRASDACPGQPLAAQRLHAVLISTDCVAPPPDWPLAPRALWPALVPARIPDDPDPTDAAVPTFEVEWTRAGAGEAIAYCGGGAHAVPLTGTLHGGEASVSRVLGGAVLAACAATCEATSTLTVAGALDLGPPGRFDGTLTETLAARAGAPPSDCGGCTLPCTSTYALTGGSP